MKKIYTCFKCGKYTTMVKCNYVRHLNRKRSCVKNDKKVNPTEPQMNPREPQMNPREPQKSKTIRHKCKYCGKAFSTNSHMNRHMRLHCKENKTNQRIRELERRLDEIRNQTHVQINCNITNNIQINNYGRENIEHLHPFLTELLTKIPTNAIPALIGKKYFDCNHPENQTVRIKNKKEKWIYVHQDGMWEVQLKRKVLHKMIDNSFQDLNDHYEEERLEDTLPTRTKEKWCQVKDSFRNRSMYKNHEVETERIILNEQKKIGIAMFK